MTLGTRIKNARRCYQNNTPQGMNQTELAYRTNILQCEHSPMPRALTARMISDFERDEKKPCSKTLRRMEMVLDLEQHFFDRDPDLQLRSNTAYQEKQIHRLFSGTPEEMLRQKWGDKFEDNIGRARHFAQQHLDQKILDLYGSDPRFVEFVHNLALQHHEPSLTPVKHHGFTYNGFAPAHGEKNLRRKMFDDFDKFINADPSPMRTRLRDKITPPAPAPEELLARHHAAERRRDALLASTVTALLFLFLLYCYR